MSSGATSPPPVRVLVVDDSAFMRKMVGEILAKTPGIVVVGQARDGADTIRQSEALRPDVVTLDVEMPVMDGIAALTALRARRPDLPVIMLSSLTQAGADTTLRCLEIGAFDFVGKPSGAISLDIERVGAEIVAKVKAAAAAATTARTAARPVPPSPPMLGGSKVGRRGEKAKAPSVLVIGASTGGPRALQTLVPALPADLGVPVVIVQHMPPGFTAALATRLNDASPLTVREAKAGDALRTGVVLVAPGGHHLIFDADGCAVLSDEPPVHGVRPAVDVTLGALAARYGARVTAVLLTGMGRDGARGLKMVHEAGGETFAEHESSCVVYGMPRAAVELDAVGHLLPLGRIAPAVCEFIAGRAVAAGSASFEKAA